MMLESTQIFDVIDPRELQLLRCERDTYAELLARIIQRQCPDFAARCGWEGDRHLVNEFLGEYGDDAFDELQGEL